MIADEEVKGAAPAKKKKKSAASGGGGAQQAAQGAPATSLQEVFAKFANGPEMDGKTFAKVAKDCKIINKKCTNTDIDLIFARNKERTARKINYQQFVSALGECATKRGQTMEELEAVILSTGGPVFAGTAADAVRFHDDKDQYTGVHARGGPSNFDGNRGLDGLLDRSDADVRGVKK